MGRLRFVTEWSFDASREGVWALLGDPERYPSWWPGFEEVRTVSGDGEVGSVTEHRVNVGMGLVLRFRMEVQERRPAEYVRLSVTGDSAGVTEWRLEERDGRTAVTHVWDVDVQRPLLRIASSFPGSRGFFARRHYRTMGAGRANLERLLGENP